MRGNIHVLDISRIIPSPFKHSSVPYSNTELCICLLQTQNRSRTAQTLDVNLESEPQQCNCCECPAFVTLFYNYQFICSWKKRFQFQTIRVQWECGEGRKWGRSGMMEQFGKYSGKIWWKLQAYTNILTNTCAPKFCLCRSASQMPFLDTSGDMDNKTCQNIFVVGRKLKQTGV